MINKMRLLLSTLLTMGLTACVLTEDPENPCFKEGEYYDSKACNDKIAQTGGLSSVLGVSSNTQNSSEINASSIIGSSSVDLLSSSAGVSSNVVISSLAISSQVQISSSSTALYGNNSAYVAVLSAGYWRLLPEKMDYWGSLTNERGTNAAIAPDSDHPSGGNSRVIAALDGTCLGFCDNDVMNWKLDKALKNSRLSVGFKITSYIPNTASSWGYASAAMIAVPYHKSTVSGMVEDADFMELTSAHKLSIKFKYTAGQILYIQLLGPKAYIDTETKGNIEIGIVATGVDQVVEIPVSDFKYSFEKSTPDYTKLTGIGFTRILKANFSGEAFRTSEPEKTDLELICFSNKAGACNY
jgi:hypothetical protein